MKIKHILVEHEYQASDLLRKIDQGEKFEELAQKFSKCSSSAQGGDLGDLSKKKDKLEENFLDACERLKNGQISKPVRTRFGYHLIFRYA